MTTAVSVDLEQYRQFFAEEVAASAGIEDAALVEAFASVPRERFLGPGPWQIVTSEGLRVPTAAGGPSMRYRTTVDDDPRRLYHNVLVAIDPARELNNGHPGSLAAWIDALRLQRGDHVLHIGCGVGYYTAIMGHVVGATGHVTGIEVDADLAARARANVSDLANVSAEEADGASYDPGPVDAILVNAGATHPRRLWLDRLRPGGRLLVPLTFTLTHPFTMSPMSAGTGFVLLVTRGAAGYAARFVSHVSIYSGGSMRRDSSNALLLASMPKIATIGSVQSLRLDEHTPGEGCWLHDVDYCLSTEKLPA